MPDQAGEDDLLFQTTEDLIVAFQKVAQTWQDAARGSEQSIVQSPPK
jgi:hypothetical protein